VQEWSVLVSSLFDWRRKSWHQILDVKQLENGCPLIIARKRGEAVGYTEICNEKTDVAEVAPEDRVSVVEACLKKK